MKKYFKSLPFWVKTSMIFGILGLVVTLMQTASPSFLHLNLIAAAFGVVAYSIL